MWACRRGRFSQASTAAPSRATSRTPSRRRAWSSRGTRARPSPLAQGHVHGDELRPVAAAAPPPPLRPLAAPPIQLRRWRGGAGSASQPPAGATASALRRFGVTLRPAVPAVSIWNGRPARQIAAATGTHAAIASRSASSEGNHCDRAGSGVSTCEGRAADRAPALHGRGEVDARVIAAIVGGRCELTATSARRQRTSAGRFAASTRRT